MTRGVLIFAFNNDQIDYVSMAAWSARRISRHLNLPVTLVTDQTPTDSKIFDQIIITQPRTASTRWFDDFESNVSWFNGNRVDAYSITPYDQTLVLDSDYIVASDQLNVLFDSNQDFVCHNRAVDVTNSPDYDRNNYFGKFDMPMCWATVLFFQKSNTAQAVFDMLERIKENWNYYRNLYGINSQAYRNDFAVSIALNTIFGHQATWPGIPWNLLNVDPMHRVSQLDQDHFKIDFVSEQKPRYVTVKNCDFHAMCKKSLGEIIASSS